MTDKLKELKNLATPTAGQAPTQADVKKMQDLANQIEAIALGPVDTEGNIQKKNAL